MSELDKLIAKWREEWPLPNDCDYSYRIDAGARHNCADDLESRKAAIEREIRLDELRALRESLVNLPGKAITRLRQAHRGTGSGREGDKMKIAIVEFRRCGEYQEKMYCWIPDKMMEAEFAAIVNRVASEHLAAEREWQAAMKVRDPGWSPRYDSFPDRTVREVRDEHAKAKEAYQAYYRLERDAKRSFHERLTGAGAGIGSLCDHEPEVTACVDWGHNDGVDIKVSPAPLPSEDEESEF